MAPTSSPLVNLQDVKAGLPVREGNVGFDVRLRQLSIVATRQIEQATKRFFTRQAFTQHFSSRDTATRTLDLVGDDRATVQTNIESFHTQGSVLVTEPQTLSLQSLPIDIAQPVEVIYDPLGRFSGNQTFIVVNPDNYVVDEDNGLLHLRFPMARGRRRIRVTFTGGFASAGTGGDESLSVALEAGGFEDLRQAAVIQTQFLFLKLDRENVGKKADRKQGGASLDFMKGAGLAPEVGSLLTNYKAILKGSG